MPQIEFNLNISREKYLSWYSGNAKQVVARSIHGQNVRFPAERLRPFVTHLGVKGRFIIHFDDQHKFVSLEKVAE
ncbi:MAG TPA: DUF2835 family protein [Aeromonadales bacterium]|nr:DUF2835 family protein [Aeromonadales bacterium]